MEGIYLQLDDISWPSKWPYIRRTNRTYRMCTVVEFFEDSEVFITGGSGVVGKALIEKLLRSTRVRRIYVLLRPKKQFTAEQRLTRLRQATIFHVLAKERPQELQKLVAVPGDVAHPGMGIQPEWLARMRGVSVVYHCAATVRFDEPLRVALRLNVAGTLEALKLAEQLPKLRIFVHVSTFYSNPYLTRVEPKVVSSGVWVCLVFFFLKCPLLELSAVLLVAHGLETVPETLGRSAGRQLARCPDPQVGTLRESDGVE